MKIIKQGTQIFYKGRCDECRTEIICTNYTDKGAIKTGFIPDVFAKVVFGAYIKCPVCSKPIILDEIEEKEYKELLNENH